MKYKAKDIVITKHAHARFLERFRLYFSGLKLSSTFLWENVMIAQILKGHVCNRWLQSPFWRNMVFCRYGKNMIVIRKAPCFYLCNEQNGKLIVKTVVPQWFNEK